MGLSELVWACGESWIDSSGSAGVTEDVDLRGGIFGSGLPYPLGASDFVGLRGWWGSGGQFVGSGGYMDAEFVFEMTFCAGISVGNFWGLGGWLGGEVRTRNSRRGGRGGCGDDGGVAIRRISGP